MTLEAAELFASGARVVLHTGRCECAEWLRDKEIAFETLDGLYDSCEDFDEHTRLAAQKLAEMAEAGDVVFGVFDVRDRAALALRAQPGLDIRVVAGPPVEGALFGELEGSALLLEASDWENYALDASQNTLIRELDSRELAGEVKLKLMDVYPEEGNVLVRFPEGSVAAVPLYRLDRLDHYDHRTAVLVPAVRDLTGLERYGIGQLNEVIHRLCAPDGCPWDRVQTHQSLRPYLIEEAYEAIDAIDSGETDHLAEELGDVLLQVVLHAEIARRHGEFTFQDVTSGITGKMIRRHTHIFGGDTATDAEGVLDLWSRNKMKERDERTYTETMRDITRALPSTERAAKLCKRLETALGRKIDPALAEEDWKACAAGEALDGEASFGRTMFALMRLAYLRHVDPEIALNRTCEAFIAAFERFEQAAEAAGCAPSEMPADAHSDYWDLVKLCGSVE